MWLILAVFILAVSFGLAILAGFLTVRRAKPTQIWTEWRTFKKRSPFCVKKSHGYAVKLSNRKMNRVALVQRTSRKCNRRAGGCHHFFSGMTSAFASRG